MAEWTIQKLLNWITDHLTENRIDSPRLSAELLLSHVLDLQRIELYTNFDHPIQQPQLDKLHDLVKRCAAHEPVAYLVGRTEFYSLQIKVTPDCLIPRPETETLVDCAVDFLRSRTDKAPQYLCDLCTGSACIAIAIAKNTSNTNTLATDKSSTALAVAADNIAHHNLTDRINLLCGDLFAPLPANTQFDLIVSNPPYITTAEYSSLDRNIKDYEPKAALLAGQDGLDVYRIIAEKADQFLKPDAALILEISPQLAEPVKQLLHQTNIFKEIKTQKDLQRNNRVIIALR